MLLVIGEGGGIGLAVWQWQFPQKTCLSLETEGGETISAGVGVSVWKGGSGGHGGEVWRGGKQRELDQKKEIGHMEMRLQEGQLWGEASILEKEFHRDQRWEARCQSQGAQNNESPVRWDFAWDSVPALVSVLRALSEGWPETSWANVELTVC